MGGGGGEEVGAAEKEIEGERVQSSPLNDTENLSTVFVVFLFSAQGFVSLYDRSTWSTLNFKLSYYFITGNTNLD